MRPVFLFVSAAAVFVAAIASAQMTHAPLSGSVSAPETLDPAKTFTDNCSACHQEDGKGIPGAFPALAGDKFVVGPATGPIGVVLNGRAGMPTFKADLTDGQIAAALTYVRSAWGNAAPAVTPDQVKAQRTGDAPQPDKHPIQAH
jgi:mono/diheme cytochrome c family protein